MKLRNHEGLPNSLEEIFASPLLAGVKPAQDRAAAHSDPAVSNFLEIVEFAHAHRRLPIADDPTERSLARRLKAYQDNPDLAAKVREHDDCGLLGPEPEKPKREDKEEAAESSPPSSIDDILAGDSLGLLDGVRSDIFDLRHVDRFEEKEKAQPDEIGRRGPCQDFWRYESLFHEVRKLLGTKTVMLAQPREAHIRTGSLFIVRGQICYVGTELKGREGALNKGSENKRYHVVFDNGTEVNILAHSFANALYADAHSKFIDARRNLFSSESLVISGKDRPTGFVYVLETLSQAPELAELKNRRALVKIGYCTQTVRERTANAEHEQTYLCAKVRIAAEIACFNLNPKAFEKLVHAFLCKQQLQVRLRDRTGKTYRPKEWFTVDVETAVEICRHIVAGDIGQYRMDDTTGEMVKK